MTDGWALRRLASSIRTRLLVTIIVVLAVGIGGTVVVTRQVLLANIDERIDDQLRQEAEELRVFAEQGLDPETGEAFGSDARRLLEVFLARTVPTRGEAMVTYLDGRPSQRSAQRVPYRVDTDPELTSLWASTSITQRGVASTPAGPFEFLAVPVNGDDDTHAVFVVGLFRDLVAGEVEDTLRVTAWVALASLAAGLVIAVGLASRILTPLNAVTRAARDLTESDLSGRLDVEGHDEVAQLATTFNGMLDRLEEAFVLQRQFVDDAGHELRTPITVIRGHLELLGDDPGEQARQETIDLLIDELDRMHRIVEDLLLLAKSEQPDFVRPVPFDLDQLTTSVHRKATAISPRHEWVLDAVGVGRVVGDPQRLTQALVQLADNAAKYTPEGTTIGIGSVRDVDAVRLWVRDEGAGVAAEDQTRIFGRFARGSGGHRRSEGAGLGLAIVQAIARAHGGDVDLASLPGQGAVFTVHMPAERDPDLDRAVDGDHIEDTLDAEDSEDQTVVLPSTTRPPTP